MEVSACAIRARLALGYPSSYDRWPLSPAFVGLVRNILQEIKATGIAIVSGPRIGAVVKWCLIWIDESWLLTGLDI